MIFSIQVSKVESKVNYALVGLFVSLLGFALVAVVLWLSSGTEDRQYTRYQAHMTESVSGLNTNALVKYRGVTVGSVKKISLAPDNPEKVRLILDIEEGTPVKADTVAMLNTQGLTGLAYIELTGGTRSSPPLLNPELGQTYPEIQTRPSLFVRLDQGVSTILTQVESVTKVADEFIKRLNTLLSNDNRTAVNDILSNIDQLTTSLAKQSDTIAVSTEQLLRNSAQFSEGLPALMKTIQVSAEHVSSTAATTDELLRSTQEDIRRTTLALADLSENMNQTLSGSRHDINQFTQTALPEISILLRDLRDLSASLQHVAQDLSRQPNQLIFGKAVNRPGPGE
ncbi:MAG: MlaD family protein [Pseudomonadota bacterium]